MKKLLKIITCTPLIYSFYTMAHEYSSLTSHEHGKLALNIVFDKDVLDIELEGPAANITGFEYAPTIEEDKKLAGLAKKQFENPITLFALSPEAKCKVTQKEIKGSIFAHLENAEQHNKTQKYQHSDITTSYRFICDNASKLIQLDFSHFFTVFPLTKQLNLQYIGSTEQRGAMITANNPVFKLAQ